MTENDDLFRRLGELRAREADSRVCDVIHRRARERFERPPVRAPVPVAQWVELAAAACAAAILLGWALSTAQSILG